jgi:guanosine-3',5'-bis(diphosphate) 3'-pyrophosphohydrolase
MGRIKAELEDLAFRYVEPEEYLRIAALIEPRRKKAESDLAAFRAKLAGMMKANGIPVEIHARIKRPYSIFRKMKTQKIDFNQVYDFLALRIITDSVKSCYAALGIIHQEWPPIPQRFRDFIAMPKPNLYQALHTTVITERKVSFEIQIRTRDLHALAENGIAAHWKYKDEDPQGLVREDRRLQWLREMVELFAEQKNPKEFLKHLKINLIPEEVYVFTPKGQVVSLPSGASALDFAFRIHSAIGLHSASARINGKAAPLKTVLKTGDIVEIVTQPDKSPSRGWLNIAFTSGARQQIKRALNQQEKTKSEGLGRKLWEKEVRKYDIPVDRLAGADLVGRLRQVTGLRLTGLEDFFAQAGLGRVMINRKLMEKVFPSGLKARRDGRGRGDAEPAIQVKDRDVALIHLARCCRPIKGEPIVGYLTAGKGVTVHARRCRRIAREVLAPERWVDVTWEGVAIENFRAKLVVRSADKPGILAAVVAVISGREGDIAKAEVETYPDGRAQIKFSLVVRDIRHLDDIIADIKALDDIDYVERV